MFNLDGLPGRARRWQIALVARCHAGDKTTPMSVYFSQSLPPHLRRLVEADYPRFSAAEMARRRAAIENLLAEAEVDHLVFCGLNRTGSAVQWLTQWPVTAEAVGVLSPGKHDVLFVQYVNHAPLAREFATDAERVEWGGQSCIQKAVEALEQRGARPDRVGVIGPMTFEQHAVLAARFGK